VLKGIDTDWPLFLGYNKISAKSDGRVLATVDDNPFIIVGDYGKGRTMAFASDLSKHWGTAFIEWNDYAAYWRNAIKWLAGRD
jgi:uncharacterized membrane protein